MSQKAAFMHLEKEFVNHRAPQPEPMTLGQWKKWERTDEGKAGLKAEEEAREEFYRIANAAMNSTHCCCGTALVVCKFCEARWCTAHAEASPLKCPACGKKR